MKKVYCDFCGKEIKKHYSGPIGYRGTFDGGKIVFSPFRENGEQHTISFDTCDDCFDGIKIMINMITKENPEAFDRQKRMALRNYARRLNVKLVDSRFEDLDIPKTQDRQ